jgi:hypothetical protein
LFSGSALADTFVFDATSSQIAGHYIPVGGGHYNGGVEIFDELTGGLAVLHGQFQFNPGEVPVNPNATLPCLFPSLVRVGFCWDSSQFLAADDGSLVAPYGGQPGGGIAIYNTAGDPLALMVASCGVQAICQMNFYAGIQGNPIDVAVLQAQYGLQADLTSFHRIVAAGGLQDAIDAHFYDGSIDSFQFVLTTPEPSSLFLLIPPLVGFALRRRFHSSLKRAVRADD